MSNIVRKARILQDKIESRRKDKKQLREQKYRLFLQTTKRSLPSLEKLLRWRYIMLLTCFLSLLVPCIQVIFFYDTLFYTPSSEATVFFQRTLFYEAPDEVKLAKLLEYIPTIGGILFLIFGSFAATIDFAIFRRFKKKYIIKW